MHLETFLVCLKLVWTDINMFSVCYPDHVVAHVWLGGVFGNLILNWPKLLRPFKIVFFSPYIDVYVFAM